MMCASSTSPAAQMAAAPGLVDTDARPSEVPTSGMGTVVHVEPAQFSVTASPTAHTLLAELAVTLVSEPGRAGRIRDDAPARAVVVLDQRALRAAPEHPEQQSELTIS